MRNQIVRMRLQAQRNYRLAIGQRKKKLIQKMQPVRLRSNQSGERAVCRRRRHTRGSCCASNFFTPVLMGRVWDVTQSSDRDRQRAPTEQYVARIKGCARNNEKLLVDVVASTLATLSSESASVIDSRLLLKLI